MTLDFKSLVIDLRHDGTGERQYMRDARSDLGDKLQNAAGAIEHLQAEVDRLSQALAAETAKREAMEKVLRLVRRAEDLREEYHRLPNDKNRIGEKKSRKSRARDAWLREFRKASASATIALLTQGGR